MKNEDIEEKIDDLEKLIVNKKEPFFLKHGKTILAVFVLLAGIIASYTTYGVSIEILEKEVKELKQANREQDREMQDIKLKSVKDSTDLGHIFNAIQEINNKLDDLNEKLEKTK